MKSAKSYKVAFLGMGVMGTPMTINLKTKGFDVTVWNRTPNTKRTQRAIEAGCHAVSRLRDAVAKAEVVGICISDVTDVEDVLFNTDDGGVAHWARRGSLVIDFSTGSPKSATEFGRRLGERGIRFLDSPVTGGDIGAANGTLTVFAGGARDDIVEAKPIFDAVGTRTFHCGAVGSGQSLKLVNQVLCAIHAVALAEALHFAAHLGLERSMVVEACAGGAGGSWALSNLGPRTISEDYSTGFSAKLMRKDLRLVREEKCILPGVELADQLLAMSQSLLKEPEPATQAMILPYMRGINLTDGLLVWLTNCPPYRR